LLERLLFESADILVANTDATTTMWRERYPDASEKMFELWNGYDPDSSMEFEKTESVERQVVTYVGSFYQNRQPIELIRSMGRLLQRGELDPKQVCLQIVGPISRGSDWVNDQATILLEESGCLRIESRTVAREEASHLMKNSNYLLLLDLNESEITLQVPAKLFEIIQFGRPVLAFTRRSSPTERILKQSGIPSQIISQDESDREKDCKVHAFLQIQSEQGYSHEWFDQRFNGRDQVRKLATLLNQLRKHHELNVARTR
jgi:hypothetical protein